MAEKINSFISIPEFYNGKSVFITGGTGFLGKIIIEKLLRSCTGIEAIYILCRTKKDKDVKARLDAYKLTPIFSLIQKQNSKLMDKLIFVDGDIAKINLGISKENLEILKEKVSVIINCAATVSFKDPLKIAIDTNLRSVQELLALSREIKDLKSFVHISTAYANWFDVDVAEEVKPTSNDPNHMIALANFLPETVVEQLTPQFLGKHVNTYTYTKALAENFILNNGNDLPIAIVRPSMVGACMVEPFPGWIDSMGALAIYLYGIAKGLLSSFHISHKYAPCDLIPADLVSNLTIAAGWKIGMEEHSKGKNPQVYHIASSMINPISFKEFTETSVLLGREYPLESVFSNPKFRSHKHSYLFLADYNLTHILPAYLKSLFSKKRNDQRLLELYKSYKDGIFVTTTPNVFRTSNYKKILSCMNKSDQKEFYFDPKIIKWNEYMKDYYFGIKKHILKEKDLISTTAKRNLKRLKYGNCLMATSGVIGALVAGKSLMSGSKAS